MDVKKNLRGIIFCLVFFSGFCALGYELAWMKELKLVFGFSTTASATVLAAFSGGLGLGAWYFGKKVDLSQSPFKIFAVVELCIAILAILSPLAIGLISKIYVLMGGTIDLGLAVGTILRLFLSAIVIGVPAFFMGGTLPAATKSVQTDADKGRYTSALIYGLNTLGAVAGCALATFILFEMLGIRNHIFLCALINLLIALVLWRLDKIINPSVISSANIYLIKNEPENNTREENSEGVPIPAILVGIAAFISGFSFFLMELVWYRMLSPILGGSVYTFGLILAVALLGIGIGGLLFSIFKAKINFSFKLFATTCLLEAFFIALPFVLGDRLAYFTLILRSLGFLGFGGITVSWAIISGIVVFPTALIAGFQFPIFLALLGEGSKKLGTQVGYAYIFNMLGSLVGSLIGGFILIPYFTAPHCWRAVICLLAFVSLLFILYNTYKHKIFNMHLIVHLILVLLVGGMVFFRGPSAAWRHSGIGAGRSLPNFYTYTPNNYREWINLYNQAIFQEYEGVESSVGVEKKHGMSFVINGKSDGNTHNDAPTAMGSGLLPGIVHANPKKVLVIGMGTGSTAGYLAKIPSVERVDVVEIEPQVLTFAKLCSYVNENMFDNPKVKIHLSDGREFLQVSSEKYDIIVSEPSNPYRAGIASLFTQEFYQAVSSRLNDNGLFLNWMQGYEIDATGFSSNIATVSSVFPHIDMWFGAYPDIFLLSSKEEIIYDAKLMRERLQTPPFKRGFYRAWNTFELEGVFAHYIGNNLLIKGIATKAAKYINTDDLNYLEFGLARSSTKDFSEDLTAELRRQAIQMSSDKPAFKASNSLDLNRTRELFLWFKHLQIKEPLSIQDWQDIPKESLARLNALSIVSNMNPNEQFLTYWESQTREPTSPIEITSVAFAKALSGKLDVATLTSPNWEEILPEKLFVTAVFYNQKGETDKAFTTILQAFEALRITSIISKNNLDNMFKFSEYLARNHKDESRMRQLYKTLGAPFAGNAYENLRLNIRVQLIAQTNLWKELCQEAISVFEPWALWNENFLTMRFFCYKETTNPLVDIAEKDLKKFSAARLQRLGEIMN